MKAVALRYPENAEAPFISVKGKGNKAEKIIEIAKANNIPVIKNPETAEILSVQECGEYIPESTYKVIAEIFAFIRSIEKSYE